MRLKNRINFVLSIFYQQKCHIEFDAINEQDGSHFILINQIHLSANHLIAFILLLLLCSLRCISHLKLSANKNQKHRITTLRDHFSNENADLKIQLQLSE